METQIGHFLMKSLSILYLIYHLCSLPQERFNATPLGDVSPVNCGGDIEARFPLWISSFPNFNFSHPSPKAFAFAAAHHVLVSVW